MESEHDAFQKEELHALETSGKHLWKSQSYLERGLQCLQKQPCCSFFLRCCFTRVSLSVYRSSQIHHAAYLSTALKLLARETLRDWTPLNLKTLHKKRGMRFNLKKLWRTNISSPHQKNWTTGRKKPQETSARNYLKNGKIHDSWCSDPKGWEFSRFKTAIRGLWAG